MSNAIQGVLAERMRQMDEEGWTPEHDDTHTHGEMARAAGVYALIGSGFYTEGDMKAFWPWNEAWFKPKDRRRNLERAAALLIAELERMDREEARETLHEEGE